MSIEISNKCPECGYEHMQEEDREYTIVPSMDHDLPDDQEDYSLSEWCSNCGFQQTKHIHDI